MDLGLTGKLALVTGGSKGIGLACAKAFAAEGARVAICSRSQDNLHRALAELPEAAGFQADLVDPDQAAAMLRAVEGRLGPVAILVNSAGAARRMPPEELTPQAWRAAMDSKYFSYINVLDPMVKAMAARGHGVIVNVIGVGGKVADPVHLAGGAANAALMLVTAGLATAYAARGIRVVGVNPGMTETDRMVERIQADARIQGVSLAEARARSVARIPMGRMAAPEEVAQAVVFLASGQASYINGATIAMDGAQNPVIL
jgi:NAD(P)-dependent dehydrogenase (short-subunit alcohol dehydrogenase family)